MVFESAMQAMRFGHSVRRKSWPEGESIAIRNNILIEESTGTPVGSINPDDSLADDWELK